MHTARSSQTRTRVALSTLTVWVVYVAFFYLHLFISEHVDRDIILGHETDLLYLWTFLGTLAVLIFITYLIIRPLTKFLYSSSDSTIVPQCFFHSLFFYIIICTITFFPPFKKFRELKLAEDGLIGDRPYSIGCMRSTTPSKLTLPANHSYFTLEDPEWTVDWNRRKNHEAWGWSHTVAPIVYNGPVVGCQFDPPLWAVCVVQGSSMEACGFDESKIGAYTSMRRFHSIHYMDTEEKDRLKKVGDADYMVEFNSPTMAEVMGIVSQTKEEKARMWFISLVSFAGSTFLVVIYVNYDHARLLEREHAREVLEAKNATYSVPSSEDHEMQVCKQHFVTSPHPTSPQAADPLLESYIAPPPPELVMPPPENVPTPSLSRSSSVADPSLLAANPPAAAPWEQAGRPYVRHEYPVVFPIQQLPQPARGRGSNYSAPQWEQEQWDPHQATPPPQPSRGWDRRFQGNPNAPQWQQEQWDPNTATPATPPPHRVVPNFRQGLPNSSCTI